MKKGIVAVTTFVVVLIIMYGVVLVDLIINPWLKEITDWQWWNYITSRHCGAYIFLHSQKLWLVISSIWAGIAALITYVKAD